MGSDPDPDTVDRSIEMRISKSGARAYLVALAVASGLAVMPAPGFAASGAAPSSEVSPGTMPGVPARQPAAGGYGYGRGRAMMGGWGGGYGPGMMGGWGDGHGPRMMGRWSGEYGPGMMNGWGGGWDGGYFMGPGMMRGRGLAGAGLEFSDEQRDKIEKIHANAADTQWNLAGKIFAAVGKLHELLASEAPDRDAIRSAYKALSDLRLQQLEASLDMRANVDAVLTKEQREWLQTWRQNAPELR
ncbi:MAG: periplasmic heavy metal sensor [Comamonas sp.]